MERQNCPNRSLEIYSYGTANRTQTSISMVLRKPISSVTAGGRIRLSDGFLPLPGAILGPQRFSHMTKVWVGANVGWTYLVEVIDGCTGEIVGGTCHVADRSFSVLAGLLFAVCVLGSFIYI
jgi:hypothetical protein